MKNASSCENEMRNLTGMEAFVFSIFFDDLNLQEITIQTFYKIVLGKTRFAVAFEFPDVFVQPDRVAQIKGETNFFQGAEHLVGAGVLMGIFNADVLQHAIDVIANR